ncbi:DNA-directed RNA polymerase subunit H [Candidatus Woesearchaeota archaeon]|nr:MAG: DNA-directed RNA polymerase subunit H [Candidatus Woesearchaeota archaeon]
MVKKSKINHILVPEHKKLSDKAKKDLLDKYNITLNELPRIHLSDRAISHLEPKVDDVIMIIRKSPTAGESIFYRRVVNE